MKWVIILQIAIEADTMIDIVRVTWIEIVYD